MRKIRDHSREEGSDDSEDENEDNEENSIISTGVEKPINKMIPLSKLGIDVKYFWKNAGFTHCTASCLGGMYSNNI
jgi:hypothetical protein